MTPETLEVLKWTIGIPAFLITTMTIPYVVRKHHLECRKLRLEIRKLHKELGDEIPAGYYTTPGAITTWLAKRWTKIGIPLTNTCVALGLLGYIYFRSFAILIVAQSIYMSFVIAGIIAEEAYYNYVFRKVGLKPPKSD